MAVEGIGQEVSSSHVKNGKTIRKPVSEMSADDKLAADLLVQAAGEIIPELATALDTAYASGDTQGAEALLALQSGFVKSDFSIRNLGSGVNGEAHVHLRGSVIDSASIAFDSAEVLDTFRNGSKAFKSRGYTLDLPRGLPGVKALFLHELRHTTSQNIFGNQNKVQQLRARDADNFVKKFYGL